MGKNRPADQEFSQQVYGKNTVKIARHHFMRFQICETGGLRAIERNFNLAESMGDLRYGIGEVGFRTCVLLQRHGRLELLLGSLESSAVEIKQSDSGQGGGHSFGKGKPQGRSRQR